jgi:polyvinyl alcohol dehydrogenase (cytochrome)
MKISLVKLICICALASVGAMAQDQAPGQGRGGRGAVAVPGQPQPILGQPGYPPRPYQENREGYGAVMFGDYCRSCHSSQPKPGVPDPVAIKNMSPERIYASMVTGSMKDMANDLDDTQKRGVAEWMAGRKLGGTDLGDPKSMGGACAGKSPVHNTAAAWDGWSPQPTNARFQNDQSAGLTAAQVPNLKVKWAFGVPGAKSMYAQPSVFGDRVFVGSDNGWMYSVDAATGCLYWGFQAQSGIRSAAVVGSIGTGSSRFAAFFGDVHGNVYAVDASNGELLWKVLADSQPLARVIGSPKLYEGRLYVPVTGLDEVESGSPNFPCCTSRGSVVALDAATGKEIWKTYTLPEPAQLVTKIGGREIWGPSGAGVWNSPTIDVKRRALYFGTGNALSGPEPKTTDSVMALNMDTGKLLWNFQGTYGDLWRSGGPDVDFSASPILATLADGHDIIVAAQKSGTVWCLDPDRNGTLLWKYETPSERSRAIITFGGAADAQTAYFNSRPGVFAVQLSNGKEKWFFPFPPPSEAMKSHVGASAAMTAITGAAFSVGLDGVIRALAATDGSLLWEFNTAQEFKTVNGVSAKGGSMGSGGVALVNGRLIVVSGYNGFQNGEAGNVLLAFEPSK